MIEETFPPVYQPEEALPPVSQPEEAPKEEFMTLENAGKGLAFLGMVVFLLNILFYLLSRGQPDQFHLFAGENHLIYMSLIALIFVITGYFLTKVKSKQEA